MSGAVGSIVADALNLANQPAPVVLGTLILEGSEAPSSITVGGAHLVSIHKFPGGGRVIDAMGPDESAISWRGLFVGPSASGRVRTLDAMRVGGQSCTLSFGDYLFTVVVVELKYSYQSRGAVISYAVRTEIVAEPASAAGTNPIEQLLSDCGLAQQMLTTTTASIAAYGGIVTAGTTLFGPMLEKVSALIGSSTQGVLPGGGTDDLDPGTLDAPAEGIQSAIAAVSVGLLENGAAPLAVKDGSELAAAAVGAGVLAGLVRSGGYMNRAAVNLAVSNGSTVAPIIHS